MNSKRTYLLELLKKNPYNLKIKGVWFIASLIGFTIFLFLLKDVFNLFDWTLHHPLYLLWIYFSFDLICYIIIFIPLQRWRDFIDGYEIYKKQMEPKK